MYMYMYLLLQLYEYGPVRGTAIQLSYRSSYMYSCTSIVRSAELRAGSYRSLPPYLSTTAVVILVVQTHRGTDAAAAAAAIQLYNTVQAAATRTWYYM